MSAKRELRSSRKAPRESNISYAHERSRAIAGGVLIDYRDLAFIGGVRLPNINQIGKCGLPIDVPKAGFTSREKGVLRKAMSDYAERGGFPDVQDVLSGMRAAMLQEYVDAVLYRDIIERHEVASVQALKYTLEYLFHNYARKTSTRSISGVLKNLSVSANRESIADYLDWFKDAYLVYPVSVLSDSLAVKRVNPDK